MLMKNGKSKFLIITLISMIAILFISGCSSVQKTNKEQNTPAKTNTVQFPTKPITILLAYGTGGLNDIAARAIAPWLEEQLGVPVKVDNRPSAGGVEGRNYAYSLPPDGYTVMVGPISEVFISRQYAEASSYKEGFMNAFKPIGSWYNNLVYAVVVPNSSPYKKWEDVLAAAKSKKLSYGMVGTLGGSGHVLNMLIRRTFGVDFNIVPYGGAELASAIRGGHLEIAAANVPNSTMDPKAMRFLVLTGKERSSIYPDIPTFTELGYPNLVFTQDVVAYVRKDTPPEIADKLANALEKAYESKGYKEWESKMKLPKTRFIKGKELTESMTNLDKAVNEILPDLLKESRGKK